VVRRVDAIAMGSAMGHTMNTCGCTNALGFHTTAGLVMQIHDIEPWNAKDLVRARLKLQEELAKRTPLRSVPVQVGMQFMCDRFVGTFQTEVSKDQFVQACMDLLKYKGITHTRKDLEELYDIFNSMDFDQSGALSLGEWAAGLSFFFRGDWSQRVHAVFNVLDRDNNRAINKKELQDYLKHFVMSMSPPTAEALRPILLKKAVDDIYTEMNLDHANDISSDEFLAWTSRGNNVVDRLADIIDKEVYQIWLAERERQAASSPWPGEGGARPPPPPRPAPPHPWSNR